MRKTILPLVLAFATFPSAAKCQDKTDDRMIAEATSALPAPLRDGAEVRAFRNGRLTVVRQGSNGLICLGDDPERDGWHVACYQDSLEPFMARGRELRASGVTNLNAINAARLADIESGVIKMPDGPAALYTLSGDDSSFDAATGEARSARGLYVLYVPYATEESTGISTESSRERPWLMAPGKPWAHVMISR
jgi:hypothetical protein